MLLRGDPSNLPGRIAWIAVRALSLAVLAAAFGFALTLGLNGDVEQTIGGINVAGHGPLGAIDVFTHRPVVYRIHMGLVHSLVSLAWAPGSQTYEFAFRALNMLLASAAAVLLGAGLARHIGRVQAWTTATLLGVALVFATPWSFLQPEWLASVYAVAGVGAALLPRRRAVGALMGGLLTAAVVAAKLATLPMAIVVLGAVLLLDRRRAGYLAVAAAAWALAWLAWTFSLPGESMWMPDMVALAPGAPWRSGLSMEDVGWALRSMGSEALEQPVVLMLPAATAYLVLGRGARRALAALAVVAIAVLLALAPLVVQGVWYLYHAQPLPIVAAAVFGLALGRAVRAHDMLGLSGLAIAAMGSAVAAGFLLSLAAGERSQHVRLALVAVALGSLLLAGVGPGLRLLRHRLHAPIWRLRLPAMAALGLAAALSLPALLPGAAWSWDTRITGRTNASWEAQSASQREHMHALSALIGHDTEVLYLAYGDVAYYMANPTDCRYPSPAFLKVATRAAYVESLATYRDNLECLVVADQPFAILQRGWLLDGPRTTTLTRLISDRYDCLRAMKVAGIEACPLRADAIP